MRGNPDIQRTDTSVQHDSTSQTNVTQVDAVSLTLLFVFPVFVICAIVSHRKYRATVLQRRIKHLNRIWQIGSCRKLS